MTTVACPGPDQCHDRNDRRIRTLSVLGRSRKQFLLHLQETGFSPLVFPGKAFLSRKTRRRGSFELNGNDQYTHYYYHKETGLYFLVVFTGLLIKCKRFNQTLSKKATANGYKCYKTKESPPAESYLKPFYRLARRVWPRSTSDDDKKRRSFDANLNVWYGYLNLIVPAPEGEGTEGSDQGSSPGQEEQGYSLEEEEQGYSLEEEEQGYSLGEEEQGYSLEADSQPRTADLQEGSPTESPDATDLWSEKVDEHSLSWSPSASSPPSDTSDWDNFSEPSSASDPPSETLDEGSSPEPPTATYPALNAHDHGFWHLPGSEGFPPPPYGQAVTPPWLAGGGPHEQPLSPTEHGFLDDHMFDGFDSLLSVPWCDGESV